MKTSTGILATLLLINSINARADCGALTRDLLGVQVSGPRAYLGNLPSGIKMAFQHNFGTHGIDMMGGQRMGFNIDSASAYWSDGRVFMVLARIHGKDDAEIDRAFRALLSLAQTDIDPNPRLVPEGQHLRCADGLSARLFKGQIATEPRIPIITLSVEHPKMKLRFECAQRPQQCENLPKGYLD